MDEIVTIVVILVLLIPATLIYLVVALSRLKTRVTTLEAMQAATPAPATPRAEKPAPPAKAADTARPAPWSKAKPFVPPPPASSEEPAAPTPEPQPTAPAAARSNAQTKVSKSAPPQAPEESPQMNFVVRKNLFSRLVDWVTNNWFYAIAAVSLALAGLFFVQYGIENGFLSPAVRITLAIAFGVALIGGGEYIRRRFGAGEDDSTAYLPETFSGAGIVAIFGGIVSARLLYGLIGPEVAFAGLFATALIAMVLGWFNGPFLAAVGVVGGMIAPFVIGGSSDNADWLYGYFAAITLLGLGIDTIRRWAWVSVVTLVAAYAAGNLVALSVVSTTGIPQALYLTALAVMAIAIPARSIWPNHDGKMVLRLLIGNRFTGWPEFPTRLSFGALLASSTLLAFLADQGWTQFWVAAAALGFLTVAMITWARNARALQDQTVIPALALLLTIDLFAPSSGMIGINPNSITWMIGLGIVVSALAGWRSLAENETAVFWGAGAALFAPILAIVLELTWFPDGKIGANIWALHVIAVAALMVFLAERFARKDGPENRLRLALATISALATIAFACALVLNSAALTVALAAVIIAGAWMDRRFDLPLMSYFVTVGVVVVGFRLIGDPGISWAQEAPILEVIAAFGGSLVALVGSLILLEPRERADTKIMLDSASWSVGGAFLSLLFYRAIAAYAGAAQTDSHWALSLTATVWIGVALAQLQRLPIGGQLRLVRLGLAGLFGVLAGIYLLGAVFPANPILNGGEVILGPVIVNTLMVAYLFPALVLMAGAMRIKSLPLSISLLLKIGAVALSAMWLGLTIRHFWQGAEGMASGTVTQPELYSYTLALLVVGAAVFYQAIARSSKVLRRAGLAVIGLAVAKAFLIDISGLGGLIRVFAFLGLGLLLAALAWLDRWGQMQNRNRAEQPGEGPAPEPLDG